MMKQRIVEIDIYETVTDEHFEKILSLIRILEGTCGAREIKPTEEKELNKIIDALTRNYKLTDAYKKEHNMTEVTKNVTVNFTFIGKNITLEAAVENNDVSIKISGVEFNSLDGEVTLNQENINDLKDFISYVEEKRYNV